MNKSQYMEWALGCGIGIARGIAVSAGVSVALVDVWESGIPAYRAAHHYTACGVAS